MPTESYRSLKVWERSIDFDAECYESSRRFQRCEIYGLASQLERAAVSVPSNIAKGSERRHTRVCRQHISIAHGSLAEAETEIIIAERLGHLDSNECRSLLLRSGQIGKMLNGLRRSRERGLQQTDH